MPRREEIGWPAELEAERSRHIVTPDHFSKAPKVIRLPLQQLHAGQERVRASLGDARFGVVMAGRRSGKTVYGARWILEGLQQQLPVGWFAPTYKVLAKAWREIARMANVAGAKVSETEHRIVLGKGELECWSLDNPDAGRSRAYARLVVDEAGMIAGLINIWHLALRATLVDYKGSALFLGTSKGMGSDFVKMHRWGEAKEPGWASARIESIDNPFIDPEEIEEARRLMPPELFDQEYRGIPAESAANPFGMKAIASCVTPQSSEPDKVWGWDFARAEDYTVGIALDLSGTVCRFERWNRRPWSETRRQVRDFTRDTYAMGDSTGIGDVIVEDLQRDGVRMEGYIFSRPSKQALMERLAAAIQQGIVKFPDGVIRAELEQFEYEYYGGSIRYSAPDDAHDDCVMALALAVYGYDRLGLARQWDRVRNFKPTKPFDNFDPEVLARAALESRRIREPKKLLPANIPATAIEEL